MKKAKRVTKRRIKSFVMDIKDILKKAYEIEKGY